MKLLILAIYSDSKDYQEMLKIQRSYFHQFKNVTSYFIDFNNDQTNDIEVKGDFIYVKGEDAYLNITYKTIKALEYALKHIHFDYVIRTNMSTIINIPELYNFCLLLPSHNVYTSGNMIMLQKLDIEGGITSNELYGTIFASGTSIIMSCDVVKFMISYQSKIRYDIVDDVAIGLFMTTYLPSAYYVHKPYFFVVPKKIKSNQVNKTMVFFRNRIQLDKKTNRKQDIKNMKIIRNQLIKYPTHFKTNKYIKHKLNKTIKLK